MGLFQAALLLIGQWHATGRGHIGLMAIRLGGSLAFKALSARDY